MRNAFQHNGWQKILARTQYLVHLFNRLAQAVVVYLGNLVATYPLGAERDQPNRGGCNLLNRADHFASLFGPSWTGGTKNSGLVTRCFSSVEFWCKRQVARAADGGSPALML